MKKNISILFFCLSILSIPVIAQSKQDGSETLQLVGMVPFGSIELKDSIIASAISELTTTTLIKSKKFKVIELDKWNLIELEMERRKGAQFLEKEIMRQGKALGANFLIVGKVINAEVYGNGTDYASQVDFTLKTLDIKSGSTLDAEEFKGVYSSNAGLFGPLTTFSPLFLKTKGYTALTIAGNTFDKIEASKHQAVKGSLIDATRNANKKVDRWLKIAFKYRLRLLLVEKEDKKDTEVIIEGGQQVNMEKKDKLKVVKIEIIEDTEPPVYHERIIAHIEATDISTNSAVCKIAKGPNPLDTKWKEQEKKLLALKKDEFKNYVILFE